MPTRLSGAHNRKLRTKNDAEIKKQSHALSCFIKKKERKKKKAFNSSEETIEKNSKSNFIESETSENCMLMMCNY